MHDFQSKRRDQALRLQQSARQQRQDLARQVALGLAEPAAVQQVRLDIATKVQQVRLDIATNSFVHQFGLWFPLPVCTMLSCCQQQVLEENVLSCPV